MAAKRICKICGKEYEYCHTERPTGMFYWKDVACCPEHGAKYFIEVAKSRGQAVPKEFAEFDTDSESEDDDDLFDDDLDDEEDEDDDEIDDDDTAD